MKKEEALQLMIQACASVQADLATHQKLQDALKVLDNLVNPEKPVDTKSK